jgi:hypothetical protein
MQCPLTMIFETVLNSPENEKLLFGVPILSPMVEYADVHSKMIRKMVNHEDVSGSSILPRSAIQMKKIARVRGHMSNVNCWRTWKRRYLLSELDDKPTQV